nr:type IV toxin-antitoxin system AbiEi family antitoxin domain-containing protein [Actinomycetota bacterium]NIY10986.1 hypothetical protein [Gemmatimonadota bacterium]NIS33980.1 type IV toxin-antitoxin system AbiEi family antitoxin domain-containing protein [Actinomycetota bacterium]NIT97184.1 type IV toxin-antitoxin system AbiEi family antitoxin domain-containing protein [Actinomycetota bacterium]NIU20863.1 type IV toxin-antitoxin system AbiEi family antitoxin domain-containing protein [Actin
MDLDQRALATAARQGGWITRVQARQLGFSPSAISRRVGSGRWVSARSAYRLIEMTQPEQLVRAASAVLPDAV